MARQQGILERNKDYEESMQKEALEEFAPQYYQRYQDEMSKYGYNPDDMLTENQFYSAMSQGKANLENTYRSIVGQTETNKKLREKTETDETKATAEAEKLKYKQTPEEAQFEKNLQNIIAKGEPTFEAPTYKPETAQGWYKQLSESEKPLEEEATRKLSEYYAMTNPYGRGGSGEIRKASATNQGIIGERWSRAYGVGQAEYEKTYSEKYNEYLRKHEELKNAYNTLNEIGMTKNTADRGLALAKLSRLWGQQDIESGRLYAQSQGEAEKRYYQSIADSMKPAQKEWYEYAIPIATSAITKTPQTTVAKTGIDTPIQDSYAIWQEENRKKQPWIKPVY